MKIALDLGNICCALGDLEERGLSQITFDIIKEIAQIESEKCQAEDERCESQVSVAERCAKETSSLKRQQECNRPSNIEQKSKNIYTRRSLRLSYIAYKRIQQGATIGYHDRNSMTYMVIRAQQEDSIKIKELAWVEDVQPAKPEIGDMLSTSNLEASCGHKSYSQ
ncbi:LOW QUALITY PROTEIN: hypothetical protein Cgig2_003764 [Carnegiea gigantea]|uniref:Uncharacterized protein n=1 Tax=Carnegiea gigantea TaxID=171969 RepID=A0A9Q1GL86_9CARY|nr:LOW QUALITY PROTEIN: hypothetical protein Cgig2_003764 [Carnegiea gigantea]